MIFSGSNYERMVFSLEINLIIKKKDYFDFGNQKTSGGIM
jgi:hypothetical protein